MSVEGFTAADFRGVADVDEFPDSSLPPGSVGPSLLFVAGLATIGIIVLGEERCGDLWWWLTHLFDTSSFVNRWHCGAWAPEHVYTDVGSDFLTAVAYVGIPASLLWFTFSSWDLIPRRSRWVPVCFGIFIVCCAVTHFNGPMPYKWPVYRWITLCKFVTACFSVPVMLKLPSTSRWLAKSWRHAERNRRTLIVRNRELRQATERLYDLNQAQKATISELRAHVGRLESVAADRGSDAEVPVRDEIAAMYATLEKLGRP